MTPLDTLYVGILMERSHTEKIIFKSWQHTYRYPRKRLAVWIHDHAGRFLFSSIPQVSTSATHLVT